MNHRKTPLVYAVSHGQPGAVSTAETSLTLTGLQPYKEYTISVKAQNRRGSSVPVTGTVWTYSDSELFFLEWVNAIHLRIYSLSGILEFVTVLISSVFT